MVSTESDSIASHPITGHDPVFEMIERFYEDHHEGLERSRRRHRYYYDGLTRIIRSRIPARSSILDVGCGAGHILLALNPHHGVGIDASARAIASAREAAGDRNLHFFQGDATDPDLLSRIGGPFDVILLVNVVTQLTDVQAAFESLRSVCHSRTRLLLYSYSRIWQPILRLAELLHIKHPTPPESWLPPEEVRHMLALADYEIVRKEYQMVWPGNIPGLSDRINRYIGHLPGIEWLSLIYGIMARPASHRFPGSRASRPSTSVIIPCCNEAGHIPELVESLPDLGPNSEFIFVEGNSTDDTEDVVRRAVEENQARSFRFLKQTGKGKGDAVRLGFSQARGEVLVILDSDLSVSPKDIPRFIGLLSKGKGELINGSRMVYPMEGRAMRFLNLLANKCFAWLFTWLLGQQVRDTLCGTKALYREDYEHIAASRAYFGDFDPFGDFDLLFGASRLNMRIVDVAVRYHERRYGRTNISRFRHGWLLLRMSFLAARKLKFV